MYRNVAQTLEKEVKAQKLLMMYLSPYTVVIFDDVIRGFRPENHVDHPWFNSVYCFYSSITARCQHVLDGTKKNFPSRREL